MSGQLSCSCMHRSIRLEDFKEYTKALGTRPTPARPVCMVYASYDPHMPHIEPWNARALYPETEFDFPNGINLPPKWPDTAFTAYRMQGYLRDLTLADMELGRFLDEIKKYPQLADNSIIMFTRYVACFGRIPVVSANTKSQSLTQKLSFPVQNIAWLACALLYIPLVVEGQP